MVLHLGGSVVLIPQTGKDWDGTEIPSYARVISAATSVGLQVNAIRGAGKVSVYL